MRRFAVAAATCIVGLLCVPGPARAAPPAREAEVKAAVVVNVLQFVDWPAGVLSNGPALVLCAAEEGGLTAALAAHGGMRIRGTTLAFRTIRRHLDNLAGCHAVFVEPDDPHVLPRLAAAARERSILVLAEGEHVIRAGAGIGLSIAGSRVVIDVNLAALRREGFGVSSKLLRLAREVID